MKTFFVFLLCCSVVFCKYLPFEECSSVKINDQNIDKFKDFIAAYEKNHYAVVKPSKEPRIPKIIHHIWFGKPLPEVYKKYVASWKKHHPSWEHKLWTNADIGSFPLLSGDKIYRTANLGQRSDIFRLEILYKYGGLYVDTDFLCLKPHDCIHHTCDFYLGLNNGTVLNSFMASKPGHPFLKKYLQEIQKVPRFHQKPGSILHQTGPFLLTRLLREYLAESTDGMMVFPTKYQYAFPAKSRAKFWKRQKLDIVEPYLPPYAFSVHLWATSWVR